MAKAAAALGVAQPSISEVISDLEHNYRVKLFDRSPRGVQLTAYGEALLKRSIVVFDEIRQSARDIEFLADPTVGQIRIAWSNLYPRRYSQRSCCSSRGSIPGSYCMSTIRQLLQRT